MVIFFHFHSHLERKQWIGFLNDRAALEFACMNTSLFQYNILKCSKSFYVCLFVFLCVKCLCAYLILSLNTLNCVQIPEFIEFVANFSQFKFYGMPTNPIYFMSIQSIVCMWHILCVSGCFFFSLFVCVCSFLLLLFYSVHGKFCEWTSLFLSRAATENPRQREE